MIYEWKRRLCRHRRLKERTCPVSQTAVFLTGSASDIFQASREIDQRMKHPVDVWLSPVHARFQSILEEKDSVRRVYLSPGEVYGRYEKILVWDSRRGPESECEN